MPQRKVWSAEEDRVLRILVEERGMLKWAHISRVMIDEFNITGRNGKQCRQRYHNHLAHGITDIEWTPQEERILFEMQESLGNKWALISTHLPGRTDNCVKNHFYSKLRKSLRRLNKKIQKNFKKEFREVKTPTLYRLIQVADSKQGLSEHSELCKKIKNQLRNYNDLVFENHNEDLQYARDLIQLVAVFDKDVRKNSKSLKGSRGSLKGSGRIDGGESGQHGVVSSTKSIYDDSQESFTNSDMFSSSSFDHHSLRGSQRLLQTTRIFRSQNIHSESQGEQEDSQQKQKEKVLYRSANNLTKSTGSRMPAIKQESIKLEHSAPDSCSEDSQRGNSFKSKGNKQIAGSDNNCMYMFGEESLEMRVLAPMPLTIEEKMEIHDDSNEFFFEGNMEIEDEDLIKNFSEMGLTPPKLGKESF